MKILLCMLFASCAAQMTSMPTTSQYAPKGYAPTGEIRYLNQGADDVIAQRREDAFRQMYEACNGEYKITYEGSESSAPTYNIRQYASYASMSSWSSQYMVIRFKCAR